MERKFEIMEALGGVNTYFVEEALPGSSQMKERFTLKLSTVAASFALVAVMGFVALTASGGFKISNGITPGAHGGDVYGDSNETSAATETETDEETVELVEPAVPFYLENGKPVLLSEMSDEALFEAVDAVTGEDRNDAYGVKYRYSLYDALYTRFWGTDDEESFGEAFLSALREVAKCDESATDESFLYDTAGRDAFLRLTIDYNGDETEDGVMFGGSDGYSFCPSKEFYAVFDLVVIRYYLEYYDVYSDGMITPELARLYLSAFGEAVECFDDGTREHLWPSRMFELVTYGIPDDEDMSR